MKMKSGSIESRIDYSVILPTLFLLIIGVLCSSQSRLSSQCSNCGGAAGHVDSLRGDAGFPGHVF